MAQFTIYRSSDTGAPTLSGTAGDLVNLLDKCLVTGYGSQTGAGWTKPFTGTNKAAFKLGAGTGFYLRVQDDAPSVANEARITGYETMTDVDTGSFPFPTAAQGVGGIAMQVARKSATADATTRNWIVAADSRTVYVFILTGDVVGAYYCFMFGDIYSLLSGDAFHCVLAARAVENSLNANSERVFHRAQNLANSDGIFIAEPYTGTGGSTEQGRHGDGAKQTSSVYAGIVPYPNPSDGAFIACRNWLHDPSLATANRFNLRGRLRGIWCPAHAIASFADGDVIVGSGELAGKTFLMIKSVYDASAAAGVCALEISNTVETN